MNIANLLVLSTAHISEETSTALNETPATKWPCAGGKYDDVGLFVYAHEENGEFDSEHIPDDLFAIMTEARQRGCDYVLLHSDAAQIPGLPTFDW